MVKKLLLTSILYTFPLFFIPVFSLNASEKTEMNNLIADACTAPPPDNFRITSVSSSFVSLAWHPVWIGATHVLEVSKKDAFGGWNPQFVIENVPDSTFTVSGLESGKEYRFKIATKCSNGDPSELSVTKDGITLILELTTEGRQPLYPIVVDCHNISLNHAWVGFKVEYVSDGLSMANYFEFRHDAGNSSNNFFTNVQIKRVSLNHPIVAVNLDGFWPTIFNPSFQNVPIPFRVDRLIAAGLDRDKIGYVNLIEHLSPASIDLCPDYNNVLQPWKSNYTFTPIISDQVIGLLPSENEERAENSIFNNKIKVQSPFNDALNVFISQSGLADIPIMFRLININGQIVMEHQLEVATTQISFPLDWLSSGIYILIVENCNKMDAFKIIKSE